MKAIEELEGMTQTDLVRIIQELEEEVENLTKDIDGLRACLNHKMKLVDGMKDMVSAVNTTFQLL